MKDRILQRGCRENHREGFTRADGEADKGIYFFVPSASMRNHYTGNNEELVTIKIKPSAKNNVFYRDNELDAANGLC